jgi:hypothetical protein
MKKQKIKEAISLFCKNPKKSWFLFFTAHPVWYSFVVNVIAAVTFVVLNFLNIIPTVLVWDLVILFFSISVIHCAYAYYIIKKYITRPVTRDLFYKVKETDPFIVLKCGEDLKIIDKPYWSKGLTCYMHLEKSGYYSHEFTSSLYGPGLKFPVTVTFKIGLTFDNYSHYSLEIAKILFDKESNKKANVSFTFSVKDFLSKKIGKIEKEKKAEMIELAKSFVDQKISESDFNKEFANIMSLKKELLPAMSHVTITFEKEIAIDKSQAFLVS